MFTKEQLIELWKSAADPSYTQPLLENPDSGIEAIEQAAVQYARESESVERNSQAMYIMPHSGQTDEPASGARFATVVLTLTRAPGTTQHEITLAAGEVYAEQVTTDYGDDGPVEVTPGRQYAVLETTTLVPGDPGPVSVPMIADRPGYGYNLPLPGTISRFVQLGAALSNQGASVVPGVGGAALVLAPRADVIGPSQVGQYVVFTAGSNRGQRRRITGYTGATPGDGGTITLAATGVATVAAVGGFIPGEVIQQGAATGIFRGEGFGYFVYEETSSTSFVPGVVTGVQSAATTTLLLIEQDPVLASETGTATWAIIGWASQAGLSITNAASPSGGRSPMLDAIGYGNRGIGRSPGEGDDAYRRRVHQLPDVVAPNAIRRAANRVLAPYGSAVCFREVGDVSRLFPGMFYDVVSSDRRYAYAYDLDLVTLGGIQASGAIDGEPLQQTTTLGHVVTGRVATFDGIPIGAAEVDGTFELGQPVIGLWSGVTFTPGAVGPGLEPADRFKLELDFTEMRAFFLLGVPPPGLGDFGIAYDTTAQLNFYDSAPFLAFLDGFPVTSAVINRRVWDAADTARAGGVGFDVYPEDLGCF